MVMALVMLVPNRVRQPKRNKFGQWYNRCAVCIWYVRIRMQVCQRIFCNEKLYNMHTHCACAVQRTTTHFTQKDQFEY